MSTQYSRHSASSLSSPQSLSWSQRHLPGMHLWFPQRNSDSEQPRYSGSERHKCFHKSRLCSWEFSVKNVTLLWEMNPTSGFILSNDNMNNVELLWKVDSPHMVGFSSDPSPQSLSKSQRHRSGMHRLLAHWKSPERKSDCWCRQTRFVFISL